MFHVTPTWAASSFVKICTAIPKHVLGRRQAAAFCDLETLIAMIYSVACKGSEELIETSFGSLKIQETNKLNSSSYHLN